MCTRRRQGKDGRVAWAAVWAAIGTTAFAQPTGEVRAGAGATLKQPVPGAAYSIDLVQIPGDASNGLKPFWMSTTEVTWDAFDPFVYRLDEPNGAPGADAVTRPSKPYLPPDRGFGHEGYAAICVSAHSARGFCEWLSAKSGRKFRLATEAEWEHAARAAQPGAFPWGDDPAGAGEFAWTAANSEGKPHPVAALKANAWGLFDMSGNVREWVEGKDGQPVVKGGAYLDKVEDTEVSDRLPLSKSWNATDPQIPKSKWWLSDGHFIGFRVVCELDDKGAAEGGNAKSPPTEPAPTTTNDQGNK